MSAASIAERVATAIRPGVESAGLVLEDVQVAPAGARTVVRIVLDLHEDQLGSLGLDQVAEVSRTISDVLDTLPALPGAYTLEVSSPGTSRPLTLPRHFRRARTRLVTVTLLDDSQVTGRLTEVVDGSLVFDDGARTVPLDRVRDGRVEVELKRAAALDESEFDDFEGSDDSDQMDGDV